MMADRSFYRYPSSIHPQFVVAKSIYEDFRESSDDFKSDGSWFRSRDTILNNDVQELSDKITRIHSNFPESREQVGRRRKKFSSKSNKRIDLLARPKYVVKKNSNRKEKRDGQQSEIDLTPLKPNRFREVTPRILQLAEPKIWNPIPENPLGKVHERALRATASQRTNELATPKRISEATLKKEKIKSQKEKRFSSCRLLQIEKSSQSNSGSILDQKLQSLLDRVYKPPFKN